MILCEKGKKTSHNSPARHMRHFLHFVIPTPLYHPLPHPPCWASNNSLPSLQTMAQLFYPFFMERSPSHFLAREFPLTLPESAQMTPPPESPLWLPGRRWGPPPAQPLPVCPEPFSVHQIKSWLSTWVCLVSQYLISAPKSLLTGSGELFSARSPCRIGFQQRSLGPILALPKRF